MTFTESDISELAVPKKFLVKKTNNDFIKKLHVIKDSKPLYQNIWIFLIINRKNHF